MEPRLDSRNQIFRALGGNHAALRLVGAYAAFKVCEYGLWIAILVYAYSEGGPTTAGLVAVALLVPAVAVALLVAPLAQRSSPVTVLRGGYAIVGVAAAATAGLLLTGSPPVFVYLGALVASGAMATTRPAQSAITPAVATEAEELMATNVLIGWVENLAILVAGLATGVGLALGGPGHAYAGAALLMSAAAFLVAPLRELDLVEPSAQPDHSVAGSSLAQLWRDRPARLLVGLLGVEYVVVGALDLLFVVVAIDVLQADRQWAAYLNAAYGVGALILGSLGALMVGRRLGRVIVATAVVLGIALAGTAVANLAFVVVLIALVGGMKTLFEVGVRVLLQCSVRPDRIARVFGFAEGLSMLGLAVGSLSVPVLVALGGPELALYGAAGLLPIIVLLTGRALLTMEQDARVPVVEISLLRQIPGFRALPSDTLEGLAHELERINLDAGQILAHQGDAADSYYAIARGRVDLWQDDTLIHTLRRADGLGDIALLRSTPRPATAVAATRVTAFRLDRDSFLSAFPADAATSQGAHTARADQVRGATGETTSSGLA